MMNATPSHASAKQARFHQLDAIRGVAALAVVLSHFASMMSSDPVGNVAFANKIVRNVMVTPFGGVLIGLPAVLLFFVLSGFALTKMLQSSRDNYIGYAIKRVARIWPPYLLSIALSIVLVMTLGWPSGEHVGGWVGKIVGHPLSANDIVDHILLLGAFEPHYNFVAWTLVYEMRISLLFPLIYMTLLRWRVKKVLIFYAALSILSVALHYAAKSQGYAAWANWTVTGHYVLFFVIGGLIALNLASIIRWYEGLGLSLRVGLLGLAVVSYTYPPQVRDIGGVFEKFPMVMSHWLILPGVTLIVIMAIASPKIESLLMKPVLQWLGKISYSLYLFHPLVLFLMMGVVSDEFNILFASLAGILISLLFAAVAYRLVELPSQKMGRELANGLRQRVAG